MRKREIFILPLYNCAFSGRWVDFSSELLTYTGISNLYGLLTPPFSNLLSSLMVNITKIIQFHHRELFFASAVVWYKIQFKITTVINPARTEAFKTRAILL